MLSICRKHDTLGTFTSKMKKYFTYLGLLIFTLCPLFAHASSNFQLPIAPTCSIDTNDPITPTNTCNLLIDNNSSTYYVSAGYVSATTTTQVDYGANYAVSELTYNVAQYSGGSFEGINFYGSEDGTNWILLTNSTSTSFGVIQVTISPIAEHFIKYEIYGISGYIQSVDIKAYGTEIIDNTTLTAFAGSAGNSNSGDTVFIEGVMLVIVFILLSSWMYNQFTERRRKPWK